MAYLNIRDHVIETKIAYLGPTDSGRATNLLHVRGDQNEGRAGVLNEMESGSGYLLSFDWRPHHAAKINDCELAVRLVATHGAVAADAAERLLVDADGVVFVVDSDRAALARNRESLAAVRGALARHGDQTRPLVVQINKRDLPHAMDAGELVKLLDLDGLPRVVACARTGEGVLPTLQQAVAGVVAAIREPSSGSASAESPRASGPKVEGNPLLAALRKILETTTSAHLTRLEERMMARLERQAPAPSPGAYDGSSLDGSLRAIAAKLAEIADDGAADEQRALMQSRLGGIEQRMADLEVALRRFTVESMRDRETRKSDLNDFAARVESAFATADVGSRGDGRLG